MSWQLEVFVVLALVLVGGAVWFERSRPSARLLAAVAALAALGVAGRIVLAPVPNVVATTDVVLLAGYVLGGAPGFAVGALSALVSNFWLGQGPWTPWQMAGWGMVGVGGAALAMLTGRRLGRIGLAVAAALAGLLYGALLDLSTMVNFGGEQSLDRYLALSARGVPFNIAHAAGNAALMLLCGPALVRMLDRYRDRFEVRWRQAPAPAALATALLALVLAAPLLGGGPGPARAADAGVAASGDAGSWLVGAQSSDGGYGTGPGASSSPGMTGWAMLGLEAVGRNPLDVRRGGRSPVDYLRRNSGELTTTGDLERTILALRGAGLSAQRFAGRNLLAELQARQGRGGSYERQVNLTAYAILARAATGEGSGSLRSAASWLRKAQNRDGGWGSTKRASSEPDSTGAALQALAVTGDGKRAAKGVGWLRGAQNRDGGWSLTKGAGSNAQSTAWALQGVLAAGTDPSSVRKGSRSGLDYLRSRQRGDGHYTYSRTSDQTPVWVTAQALTAVAREPFPISPVPRAPSAGGGGGGDRSGGGSGGGGSPGSAGRGGAGGSAKKRGGKGERRERGGVKGKAVQGGLPEAGALAAEPLAADQPGESSLPATSVLLGGLGALGAGLAVGWLLYRRRLP